jgi:hypothetical protein
MMVQWIRGDWKGGRLQIDGRPVEAGTDEHTEISIALGRRVLDEYKLGVRHLDDSKAMKMLCELFDLTSSGLCLVYDLDARFCMKSPPFTCWSQYVQTFWAISALSSYI